MLSKIFASLTRKHCDLTPAIKSFAPIVAILLLFVIVPPSSAKISLENGTYIISEVSGSAQIINNNRKAARNDARQAAYLDAIEKFLSEFMQGINDSENYSTLRDKLLAKSSSLVKNFKSTSEIINDGILTLTGNCRINERTIDDLIGPDLIKILGNPRIMILIDELVGGKPPFISTVESELLQIFEKAGYLIVDRDQARALLNLSPSSAYDDPSKLMEAARTLRADIIILGRASAGAFSKLKHLGQTLYGVSGTVQLKAILTNTAYQISSKTISRSTGRQPVGSVGKGADRVLRSATVEASGQILYKIAYSMASAGTSIRGITVNIKISDADFNDVENIEGRLKEFAGSKGELFERSYRDNILEVDVVSDQTARNIASFLSRNGVNVSALTNQTIDAKIIKRDTVQNNTQVGIVINVQINEVPSFKEAGEIEDLIRKFLETSGVEVVTKYQDKILELAIHFSGNNENSPDARKIASFLENNNIEIKSVMASLVNGTVKHDSSKYGGLLRW